MKITFENPNKVSGILTMIVEEDDYSEALLKALKDYRKQVIMPGFRPGNAPMPLVKKKYEPTLKLQEINKLLDKSLRDYIEENSLKILGDPMAAQDQAPVDIESNPPYTFMFELALSPKIELTISEEDVIDSYEVTIDDAAIDKQIDFHLQRNGTFEQVEDFQDGDMLYGEVQELEEDGTIKEGGIHVDETPILPSYLKMEEAKKLFEAAKLGDKITINPKELFPDSDLQISSLLKIEKEKVPEISTKFSFKVNKISRFKKGEISQELFDKIYGEGVVTSEKEFREKISEGLLRGILVEVEGKLSRDVKKYLEEKVGKLEYPEELLKRMLKQRNKTSDEEIEKHFSYSLKSLTWSLIRNKLFEENSLKISPEDLKETSKTLATLDILRQGIPLEPPIVDIYAENILKSENYKEYLYDIAEDTKITELFKNKAKLNIKKITLSEFENILQEENKE